MTGTTATVQLDSDNPWPGLESFDESAHTFFHGRAHEVALLLQHVVDTPATVLFGRSGLGKTSLLRAGLFPLLRDPPPQRSMDSHFLPIYVRLELKASAAPLSRQLQQSVHDAIRDDVPDAMLPSDEESLWEYLHRADLELWSARNYPLTPVIVLDQFEELFTLGERVPDIVGEFRNDLGELVENRIPSKLAARLDNDEALADQFHLRSHNYRLLISLREDFLADLEEWCRFIPALGCSRVRLLPLRAAEAFEAVHKPAEHLMTETLARRVVAIIAGDDLNHSVSDVESALLSLFCRELNEQRKLRGQPQFDEQLVEDFERDILSNYYSSCVRDMPPRVANFIENELITEKGFRDSYAREDAVPSWLTDDELGQLIGTRLLQLEDYHGAQRIELSHDVLTRVVREQRDRRRSEERVEEQKTAEKTAELRAAQHRLEELKQTAEALRRQSRILRAVLAATVVIAVLALLAAVIAALALR